MQNNLAEMETGVVGACIWANGSTFKVWFGWIGLCACRPLGGARAGWEVGNAPVGLKKGL